ncbi:hypothetical protein SMI01S_16530 [Sphingobacterium mizutaii NBRC 14946 = DSM 11724]|uniref:Uncharacterized protein n=3 Tax=Sphingobacterium mizutaii TaxID=1010 RepID=A0AAJ4X890_9SPHI|nr:hypothetical protein [Sphingobacterium mizutaii]GEM68047.1 hypothetical protein SMI01S_16530 [Sphingobacterium mizutaii NBRC 14946 = DSM 11724]SDL77644.1 hypothetical protein SAMN05192578_10928 [Sphingobacterium mizutaii]SNV38115.1 Uncharacterised protein [Sphingobacterium mizutaii]
MPEYKYEIKSEEMSSLLKKIPNALVTKGNFFVLAILVVFFYLLNRYGPRDELKLTAQIDTVYTNNKRKDLMHFSLFVSNTKNAAIKNHSNYEYRFENRSTNKRDTVTGKIDTIIYKNSNSAIILVTANSSKPLRRRTNGDIIIGKEKESFFSRILYSIFNI